MMLSSRIGSGVGTLTLASYLSRRFTYLSEEDWREKINAGLVLLNQNPSNPEAFLKPGDVVSYNLPPFEEPCADVHYTIAYEDEWMLAVDKPGNLLVHKAGKFITKNLVFLLRHASGIPSYAFVNAASRLDRETSGLVLFAKTIECLRALHRGFATGAIYKEYLAIVHGVPGDRSFTVDVPIGKDVSSTIEYRFAARGADCKDAVTLFETLAVTGNCSALRAMPRTGRTHQIRVHCAAAGMPIFGDKLYGLREADYLLWRSDPGAFSSLLEFPRQALHCRRLRLRHPVTKSEMVLEAPVPADMAGLLNKLGLPLQLFERREPGTD